jgi:hypothetical protein
MALPVPNLDNRRFEELLRDARQRITQLCPAWTDFNPSDPGMTLVELMAWLTDLTLYRVNRIPERSYVVFLNMMGVRLRPPEAARTWLVFEPSPLLGRSIEATMDGAGHPSVGLVEAGTAAQARRAEGAPLVFSTLEPLNLTPVRPVAVVFTDGEFRSPIVAAGEGKGSLLRTERQLIPLAASGERVEHLLFLGYAAAQQFEALSGGRPQSEPTLAAAPQQGLLHLDVGLKSPSDLGAYVEWERTAASSVQGQQMPLRGGWRPWTPEADSTLGLRQSGRITFRITGPVLPQQHDDGLLWLRGRLLRAQPDQLPQLTSVSFGFELPQGEAVPPDRVCHRTAQQIFNELPIPRPAQPPAEAVEVQPFGAEPAVESAFLVGSPLLERAGAEISVSFTIRNEGAVSGTAPPELRWEMFGEDGSWILVGRSTPDGALQDGAGDTPQRSFSDGTNALTRSGTVTFRRPDGISRFPVLGEVSTFLRVRVAAGVPHRIRVHEIRIAFVDLPTPFGLVVAENYGRPERLDKQLAAGEVVRPFDVRGKDRAGPTLRIGLSGRPANVLQRLFLDLQPPRETPSGVGTASPTVEVSHATGEGIRLFFASQPRGTAVPRTHWAYSTAAGWASLSLTQDGTRDLTVRGTIAFVAPPDWAAVNIDGVEAHWLQAYIEPLLSPTGRLGLAAIATNCVEAVQAEVTRDVVLTALLSDDQWQRVELPVRPLLPGVELAIRELENASEDALAELRRQPDVILEDVKAEERQGAKRAAWVRWREVPDFFGSGPNSRHYVFDPVEGTISFGDGRHGMKPPQGANRVRLIRSLRGGGRAGNLSAGTINQLVRSLDGVDRVFNPVPAEGGADAEPVEEALQRGPYALRHRERAVTAEDYVRLACEASQSVARASCTFVDGAVQVLIIPNDQTETPYPGRYLVERVQSYLEERRTIGSRLRVTGPDYVEIAASVSIALRPAFAARMQEVRQRVADALRSFVHPVGGGPDVVQRGREAELRGRSRPAGDARAGWPLGRSLHLSELYYVVEQVEGVDYAESIRLSLTGETEHRDKIPLSPTALPHFLSIRIEQVP